MPVMTKSIKAKYSHGVIEPLEKVDFAEGEEITITVSVQSQKKNSLEVDEKIRKLFGPKGEPDWDNDPLFDAVGFIKSGVDDLGENHDKYLYGLENKPSK